MGKKKAERTLTVAEVEQVLLGGIVDAVNRNEPRAARDLATAYATLKGEIPGTLPGHVVGFVGTDLQEDA